MALIVRVGVLTQVSWLNSQSDHHGHRIIPSFQLALSSSLFPVTIPQVVAVNENVFSVNAVKTNKKSTQNLI
jgi:hypothetical protein